MITITNRRNFLIYVVVMIIIVVLVNLISRGLYHRWDLTRNNIYTLSESSKTIIRKLDDRLTAKVYFSDNLEGEYANSRRYLQDYLEEFQAYSGGKFHFEFYRPEDNEDLEREAQRYGIPPMQMQAIEADRMEIKNVWMGLAFLYEDRREIIPVIQSTTGLEYDLASAIKKLIDTDRRIIGLVKDTEREGKNQNIQDLLRQTYEVRSVNLETPLAPDIDLLILNGVKDSLSTDALYNLDQFIMLGRPLFLAQNRVTADLNRGFGSQITSNLFEALEHYGVSVTTNLVADRICSQVGVETQRGIFRVRNAVDYPFFPLVQNFNKDHIVVRGMEQLRLFFTNEIAASIDSTRLGRVEFQPLMTTSPFTAVVPGPTYMLSHRNNPTFAQLDGAGRAVAGLITGAVTSIFTAETKPEDTPGFIPGTDGAQILVVGDGEFFADEAGGGIPENLNLVINAVDYLVGDEGLIELRGREVTTRPLKELSDGSRKSLKWANILGPSALMVATGLIRWRGSRRRRRILEGAYEK
jgi:gliding-associated putative ABC transporter substrate-binding component GldG